MNLKIYAATHKKVFFPKSNFIIPLHVGKEGKEDFGYIGDNTGDNISSKNKNYCELTGVYWIWKNDTDSDYIGLCHYRRYFMEPSKKFEIEYFIKNSIRRSRKLLLGKKSILERKKTIDGIKKLDVYIKKSEIFLKNNIEKYDCVLLKEYKISTTIKELITKTLEKEWIDILRDVINKKDISIIKQYDEFILGNKIMPANMIIAKKDIFNKYCSWLFDILFEVEKIIKIPDNAYKARVFGFMGEWLMNVYFMRYEYKVIKMEQLRIKNI